MATQWNYDFTPGQVLTASVMDSLGAAWESWTPQLWSGTGQATTSSAIGNYARIGKIAIVSFYLRASGAGGTGVLECRNLPAAIAPKRTGGGNNDNGAEIGAGYFLDAGVASIAGVLYATSSTAFRFLNVPGGSDYTITLANTDKFYGNIIYEIA